MSRITHKRGDTFSRNCLYRDKDQQPIDLTAYTMRAQIRSKDGTLIAELEATKQDQAVNRGYFTLYKASTATKDWPVGVHDCDIQYLANGITESTKTFEVELIKDVTFD